MGDLKGMALFKQAVGSRKTAAMLVFGFSSGLPYTLLIGTLNAWLGEEKISLATIGVLSWIGLAYSFKFLWSPLVDRWRPPFVAKLGRRKSWLVLCQSVLALSFIMLAMTSPVMAIGTFASIAVISAFFSATQDIAIDAWRVDVADEHATVEVLSAIYQFGFRVAALVGGALALVLSARLGWPVVYGLMAIVMASAVIMSLLAPDTESPEDKAGVSVLAGFHIASRRDRTIGLAVVALGWGWAILALAMFMVAALMPAAGDAPVSAGEFTKNYGAWIVIATVILPAMVAAWLNRAKEIALFKESPSNAGWQVLDHIYRALIIPMADLVGRFRWGSVIVLGLILSYRLCDSIWGPFAFPFYLDALGYSNDEVAFASKIFGVVMTIVGISIGGLMFAFAGRMATLLLGAVTAAASNLLYADLAGGGAGIDFVSRLFGLEALGAFFGTDARMIRLLVAISGENIAGGLAGAAFVAYLSSITSKQYSAVQYALLSSLTFLVGSLGRAALGEAIQAQGYAPVFNFTAALGVIAVVFVLLEWWRSSRAPQNESDMLHASEST